TGCHDDRAAGLLQRERKVEQPEAEPVLRLGDQRREPAGFDHRGPCGAIDFASCVAQLARPARASARGELGRRVAQQELFLVQQKIHGLTLFFEHDLFRKTASTFRDHAPGRSSTRLAMMLRWISTVPLPTVTRRISNRSAAGLSAVLPTMTSAALAPSGPAASTRSSDACWPSSPPAILITGAIASGAL